MHNLQNTIPMDVLSIRYDKEELSTINSVKVTCTVNCGGTVTGSAIAHKLMYVKEWLKVEAYEKCINQLEALKYELNFDNTVIFDNTLEKKVISSSWRRIRPSNYNVVSGTFYNPKNAMTHVADMNESNYTHIIVDKGKQYIIEYGGFKTSLDDDTCEITNVDFLVAFKTYTFYMEGFKYLRAALFYENVQVSSWFDLSYVANGSSRTFRINASKINWKTSDIPKLKIRIEAEHSGLGNSSTVSAYLYGLDIHIDYNNVVYV